jgi:3-oxoacyl-[acyl-carrier protein] reductase
MAAERVAMVTGGAGGIGTATARRLARDGVLVVIADIDPAAADRACAALSDEGLGVEPQALDVTDSGAVDAVIAGIGERHGRLDILVNNAGFVRDAPLVKMTNADFRAVIEVCLFGAFHCSRAAAPLMIAQGHGRIVNVTSRAYLGNPGQANYSAAKAGITGLTRTLAKELGRHGITANAVAPGLVDTDAVRAHPRYEMLVERARRENSVPRLGEPDDVAEAIAYLASPAASFITGDVLHVSGGRFG